MLLLTQEQQYSSAIDASQLHYHKYLQVLQCCKLINENRK